MIVGTAGHVDHGKTALVKALTGIDTDRLAEERRRGITIELGFAHLALPGGPVVGVVDVPGHERFVRAMAAGAGGVDLAVLAVAADEGVMPQTREHVDICRLLGVGGGVVAITKADLLPPLGAEWEQSLFRDVRALVQGSFLEGAPVVACSAKTGAGLEKLAAALASQARSLPSRSAEGPLYLPVDRAFHLKGFGTVVTGTLLSGALSLEDPVALVPGSSGSLRVRGLQIHGKAVERAEAGQRVAVNLSEIEAAKVARGAALVRPGELPESRVLDVELQLVPGAAALSRRKSAMLHLGTSQAQSAVALVDPPELRAGERGVGQLRLGAPIAALPGQRFILRGTRALEGRGGTFAGGRVLAIASPPRRKSSAPVLRALALAKDLPARVEWLLSEAGYRGHDAAELFARSGAPMKSVAEALDRLVASGAATLVDVQAHRFASGPAIRSIALKAKAILEAFHRDEPLKEGLSAEALRRRVSPELDPTVWAAAEPQLKANGVEVAGDLARLRGRTGRLSGVDAEQRGRLLAALASAGLAPPRLEELSASLAIPVARVQALLATAANEGLATKVADDMYFERRALEAVRGRLVAHLEQHREITTQAFKELVGQTRKWVIPLSEYFDREKLTLRVGDKRVLRRR